MGEHLGNRFITSHTCSSGRQVASSPLAKLSMSSSLEEGGGGGAGFRSLPMPRRRASDTSVESGGGSGGREEGLMESSDCESVDSVDPTAGQEDKQQPAAVELSHMTS